MLTTRDRADPTARAGNADDAGATAGRGRSAAIAHVALRVDPTRLRRVAVMAEERNKPVKFVLAPTALKLSASSADLGEAEETLDVDYAGAEVTIGFNSKYVLDAISPIEREQIVLEFKDGLSPGVIRSVEDEGYCCVIMPMRI